MKEVLKQIEEEEYERYHRKHKNLINSICAALSVTVLKETATLLITGKVSILAIPMGIGGLFHLALLFLIHYKETPKNTPILAALLQIGANTLSIFIALFDNIPTQMLSFLFIYVFTVISIISLNLKFYFIITLHFIFVSITIPLIFPLNSMWLIEAVFCTFLSSSLAFVSFWLLKRETDKRRYWEAQSAQKSEVSHQLFTNFPEIILGHSEKDGICYKNQAAAQFEEAYFQEGTYREIFQKMRDCDNDKRTFLEDLERFNEINQGENPHDLLDWRYKFKNYYLDMLLPPERSNSPNDSKERREIFEIKLIDYRGVLDSVKTLIVMMNVTEKIENEQAKLSAQNKNIIICSLSHEIRTPLNHIFGNY
jgi:hypothetical protein